MFEQGSQYTHSDIYDILGIPSENRGGDWDTGYHRHGDDVFIFAAVGVLGRTGHDYNNYWIGDEFHWRGKTRSKLSHRSIQYMLNPDNGHVHIFTRTGDRAPFVYEGVARAKETRDVSPVAVVWEFPDGARPRRNYWLTTHWPNRIDEVEESQAHIYLPDGREEAGSDICPGDMVLIYESVTGRTLIRTNVDGTEERIPCRTGRGGIVEIVEVATKLASVSEFEPEQYTNGTTIWWRWMAKTHKPFTNGFVPSAEVKEGLGFSKGYLFRGFGDRHSGLKRITRDQYETLLAVFKGNPVRQPISTTGEKPLGNHRWGAGGGEGEEHRILKEYVAANPSFVLGEEGVTTVQVEYQFQTNDRADIVLRDHLGRVIGVEIETEQGVDSRDGFLQAIKYRFMLAPMFAQRYDETRALLVAYSLADPVKTLCDRYDVAWREVDRTLVEEWQKSRGDG